MKTKLPEDERTQAQERLLHKKRILHHNCKWNFSYDRQRKMGFTEHGIKLPKLPPNTYIAFRTYRKMNKR